MTQHTPKMAFHSRNDREDEAVRNFLASAKTEPSSGGDEEKVVNGPPGGEVASGNQNSHYNTAATAHSIQNDRGYEGYDAGSDY